jgi:hypothetical protein
MFRAFLWLFSRADHVKTTLAANDLGRPRIAQIAGAAQTAAKFSKGGSCCNFRPLAGNRGNS